ncbi:MAG: S8 family serine peptidase [Nitrososphaerales archaeon]
MQKLASYSLLALILGMSISPILASAQSVTSTTDEINLIEKLGFSLDSVGSLETKRIIILGSGDPFALKEKVANLVTFPTVGGYIARGFVTKDDVRALAEIDGIRQIVEDVRLDYKVRTEQAVDLAVRPRTTMFNVTDILGSRIVNENMGVDGAGIKVAVVDTGVDFSNPDLHDALARDPTSNNPIMMDADGVGFAWTNMSFVANIVNGKIQTWSGRLPEGAQAAVYLDGAGKAWLPTSNIRFHAYVPWRVQINQSSITNFIMWNADMRIGTAEDYVAKRSGTHTQWYRWGVVLLPQQVVGGDFVLVTHSNDERNFDQVHFARITRLGFIPDWHFVDLEGKPVEPHKVGDGSEIVAWEDPIVNEYQSLGTIGGSAIIPSLSPDWKNWTDTNDLIGVINAEPYVGIDIDGKWFTLMTDFGGVVSPHGTSVAAAIAGRGIRSYNITGPEQFEAPTIEQKLAGVAPGSSIMPVLAIWLGDVFYGWMWASGFDYNPTTLGWEYSGRHKADIISNSWSISVWPLMETAAGLDALSALQELLSTPGSLDPSYPGTLFVHAMGNGGPGFGTITTPNTGLQTLTVGASRSWGWMKYIFGYRQTVSFDDLVHWSNRGPSHIGYVKPDVLNIGAFAFTPTSLEASVEGWTIFGGTSLATPLTSGVAALVMEGLSVSNVTWTPSMIKTIIMSTAKGLVDEPTAQGSGRVDAFSAVSYALSYGNDSMSNQFIAWTNDTHPIYAERIAKSASTYLGEVFGENQSLSGDVQTSTWFAGYPRQLQGRQAVFTVANPSEVPLNVEISPTRLSSISNQTFSGNFSDSMKAVPSGLRLDLNLTDLGLAIPEDARLATVIVRTSQGSYNEVVNFPWFTVPTSPPFVTGRLYDWEDQNEDGNVTLKELYYVNRGIGGFNLQIFDVNLPGERFQNTPLLRLETNRDNSTEWTVEIFYLKPSEWDWIDIDNSITVPARETANFEARMTIPRDAKPGFYSGFLNITGDNGQFSLLPTSVMVTPIIDSLGSSYVLGGPNGYQSPPLYDNGRLYGLGDTFGRFETGDWRIFTVNLTNPEVRFLSTQFVWDDPKASLDIFVVGPDGVINATSTIGLWNFLGLNSQSLFFPSKNSGNFSTGLTFPVSDLGVYTILAHNTHISGDEHYPAVFSGRVMGLAALTPPLISLEGGPSQGQLAGIELTGTLDYSVKLTSVAPIQSVSFAIDGVKKDLEISEFNDVQNLVIDTSDLTDGAHRLEILVTDVNGATSSHTSSIVSLNRPAPLTLSVRIPEGPNSVRLADEMVLLREAPLVIEVAGYGLQKTILSIGGKSLDVTGQSIIEIDTTDFGDGKHDLTVVTSNKLGETVFFSTDVFITNSPLFLLASFFYIFGIPLGLLITLVLIAATRERKSANV